MRETMIADGAAAQPMAPPVVAAVRTAGSSAVRAEAVDGRARGSRGDGRSKDSRPASKDKAINRGSEKRRLPPAVRHRPVFGAIDLGTNNCRLLIARPSPGHARQFQIIDAFSRIVRLGEGLSQSGRLCPKAMDRTLSALAICADKLARRGVTQVRSVATEACRRAHNCEEFVQRVYAETGLALDIITPAEETRLVVLGCRALIDEAAEYTLVFDIGGGSTELALLQRVKDGTGPKLVTDVWLSIPWGVVSLAETEPEEGRDCAARLVAYERMRARVEAHLTPLARRLPTRPHLLGASGTVTTLASLHMELPQYDRQQVDGTLVPTAEIIALSRELARLSAAERARIPGVAANRAELLVAGAAILDALVGLGAAPHLRVADRGLREGILRGMFARLAEGEYDQP